jgi:unsaturated chondroitin disaccharide hydrolase
MDTEGFDPSLPARTSGPAASPGGATTSWVEQAWNRTAKKIDRTSHRIGATFPHVSRQGRYDATPARAWTSGFWPGLLWLVYRETRDARLAALATACEERLDGPLSDYDSLDHDVGFMWGPTAFARYRLLGHAESRRRFLIAASHLAARFNLRGRFIRAWNWDKAGGAIIDCLMNLPLLFWASRELNDPRYTLLATAHTDTVVRHFLREDGSCRHIVYFDPHTGDFITAAGGQGYSADSAWARGNAWALYGLALVYKHTHEARFLDAAKRVAEFFVNHLPVDHIPYWDFSAPVNAQTPRDTSAGAIAASGVFEISRLVPSAEAERWRDGACQMARSLYENYGAWDFDEEGLLVKATGNLPAGNNVEVPLIYGDYFFVELLAKLRGKDGIFW